MSTLDIAALADQCVKCGLCLPHCPTYHVARNEAESPRGRIALAQALVRGQTPATPALTRHLDNCLACLHCERVCPSQVRYGELIVATRARLRTLTPPRRSGSVLNFLLARPRVLRAALRLANLLPVRALRPLWRVFGIERWMRELPRLPHVPVFEAKRSTPLRGRIGVVLGCVAAAVDRDVHAGARALLGALGYEAVEIAGCCGALALHRGDTAQADAFADRLRRAFVDAGVDTVLVSASGCFGGLRDHGFAGTGLHVREIHEFLASAPGIAALRFRPLAGRIALHTPCTQANVAHAGEAVRSLLARIPQLEIAGLPETPGCCGAAGDYFFDHAEIADALRAEKLEQALALQPDLLVTSNVGCRIFLDNGLLRREARVPLMHPVVLLAQQLEN